jgi:WD40 repeat protein
MIILSGRITIFRRTNKTDVLLSSHVRFSANSQFVLVGTQDSTVRLWNCHKSRCVKTYVGHTNKTYCLVACFGKAFGPGGVGERQVVVSGSEDNKVYIWDLQTREIVQVLEGHRGKYSSHHTSEAALTPPHRCCPCCCSACSLRSCCAAALLTFLIDASHEESDCIRVKGEGPFYTAVVLLIPLLCSCELNE